MGNIQKLSTRIKKRPLFYDASYNQFYMYDELYLEAAEGPCHQNLHYVYKVVCYVTMPSFGNHFITSLLKPSLAVGLHYTT